MVRSTTCKVEMITLRKLIYTSSATGSTTSNSKSIIAGTTSHSGRRPTGPRCRRVACRRLSATSGVGPMVEPVGAATSAAAMGPVAALMVLPVSS